MTVAKPITPFLVSWIAPTGGAITLPREPYHGQPARTERHSGTPRRVQPLMVRTAGEYAQSGGIA